MKEQLATVIQAWNSIPIKIMDIRKFALQSGQTIQSYVLPCSVFLLTLQGEAVIYLGQDELHTTGVQLLHGGKGTSLSIENGSQIMDVYMFLYKPQIGWVSLGNDEGKRSQQPLLQNYYFAPSYPLTLVSIAEQIYHGWTETDDLSRLQVKGLFYQWVYEQFRQWSQSNEMPVQPELAEQIARYIQEHYAEPISMETLASMFHYSSRYLARVFKRKYGCSPMDYVIQKRMNRARILLMETDVQIVPDYTSSDVIGTYERIAPTVAVAWGGDPDVINTLRTMGDIMDRKDQAEQWISTFETKLDGIRSKLSMSIAPGTTAMSFVLYNGEVLLGGEGGTLGKLIYEDFGFDMPEEYKAFADGGTVLSLEKLAAEPADYFITQMTDEEMGQMMDLFKEPVYQSIPAVKNKRIINVSRDFWNYGPYTVDKGVDVLMEQVSHLQK
ncbi:ABC transporter substrate-binding protein [Paenibacillus xylanexedens]|uniref:ABC transporter substrate-binding protein n=1 Tax=Paenibacillus xylanexedens TaxID=528191 RepID=UPI0011A4AFDE|nr:AraC family transcriptional regulator [Paenibacillus xylanexedens]